MNLATIKKLISKGAQGSAEKQMKIFLRNKQTTKFFKQAMTLSAK